MLFKHVTIYLFKGKTMEIVKLKPAFKDYLWGGNRLVKEYNKNSGFDVTAESWEVSCHPDGESIIENGKSKGLTLNEYLLNSDNKYIGSNYNSHNQFPILVKLIDSLKSLSIQVHPDDDYALKVENELGKSEMWYILDANENSYIYYGVKEKVSKQQIKSGIEDNTILDLLNKVYVKKGDCFFIEAGTIHAIGAGIVICEIQENSNSTYRVYDFNRKDAKGNLRPLHIQKALDVMKLKPNILNNDNKCILTDYGSIELLSSCKYFTAYKYCINTQIALCADSTSFNAIIVIDGEGCIHNNDQNIYAQKGDSFFVPAGLNNYSINGNLSFIKVTL